MIATGCDGDYSGTTAPVKILVVGSTDNCDQICRHCSATCSREIECEDRSFNYDYYDNETVYGIFNTYEKVKEYFADFYIINEKEEIFTLKYQLRHPVKIDTNPFIKRFRKDRLIGKREKRIGLKR